MSDPELIVASGIPQFTGDLDSLDLDTMADRRALIAVTGFAVRTTEPVAFTVSVENRP